MRCQKGVLRQIQRGNSVLLSLLLYRLQRTELVARKTFRLSKIGREFSCSTRRASGGVLQCRAIVPNSSTRRASGGVFGFSAVSSNRLLWLQAPIDWGQSIYHWLRVKPSTLRPDVRQAIAKLDQAEFSASWLARRRQSSRFLDRWLVYDSGSKRSQRHDKRYASAS